MDVKVTNESPILIKADITVPWERVAPEYKKSLQKVAGLVQVPGFRKGKTPAALVKKRYKREISGEVIEKVLPELMEEVVTQHNLQIVTQPQLLDFTLEDKQPMVINIAAEVKPEVEVLEWKGLEVDTLKIDIQDDAVDQHIEGLLEAGTTNEEITDAPAQDGDKVVVALTALDADAGDSLSDLESYTIEMGSESAHPNLVELIKEANAGDDLEGTFTGAEDDVFEEWRGKNVKVYLEMKSITRSSRPELDDDFIKGQDAEDLDGLKKQIKEDLDKEAREQEDNRLDGALIDALLQAYDFEISQRWVMEEAKTMVEMQMGPYLQMMQGQGEAQMQQLLGQMLQGAMPQAENKLKADLVLDAIGKQLELKVDDATVDEELEKYLEELKVDSVAAARANLEERGTLSFIEDMLRRREVVKLIKAEAKLTEVDELPQPEMPGMVEDALADDETEAADAGEITEAEAADAAPEADADAQQDKDA